MLEKLELVMMPSVFLLITKNWFQYTLMLLDKECFSHVVKMSVQDYSKVVGRKTYF